MDSSRPLLPCRSHAFFFPRLRGDAQAPTFPGFLSATSASSQEGETRLATFRNPYVMPTDGKTVETACWVRRVEGEQFPGFCHQLRAPGLPRALVSAIRLIHVPLPRRSVLSRRFARFGPAGTRAVRISLQSAGRTRHPSRPENYDAGVPDRLSSWKEATMRRLITEVGDWFDRRLQLAAPIREAAEHPVPRNTASWFYVFGSAALTVFLLQARNRDSAGTDLRPFSQ